MLPAHQHADPPPIPDGDVVPAPPRPHPAPPRISRAQAWQAAVIVGLVLTLMAYGILT